MCERHGLEFVGSVCGEGFCVECSSEFQESLRGSVLPKQKHPGRQQIGWTEVHGKRVWVINGEMQDG